MKKVVLLGDSIRLIGYGKMVENNLSGEFEVWQPSENCRFSQNTFRGLIEWKRYMENTDIIHWNNGHWDICDMFGDGHFTPVDQYVQIMVRMAKQMLKQAKVVIFATTTPVRSTYPNHTCADICEYNAAVVPELQKLGVVINDLYSTVSQDVDRYIIENDSIHLTDDGIAVCAKQVEQVIRTCAESI